MAEMLAARYLGPDRIEPVDVPLGQPGPGEALIRIEACGFCGSDIGIISGMHPRARAPLTVGHECAGVLAKLGSANTTLRAGDRVAIFPLITCGKCNACRNGYSHVCSRLRLYGIDTEGGMADYVKVPLENLILLPADMAPQVGALIEPLAVAVHAVKRASGGESELAVVMGAGPIGLLTGLVAQARGAGRILITDVLASRLQLARETGLEALPADSLEKAVYELTNGEGVGLVFECAGTPATARGMTTIARPRGTIVNVSVFKKPAEVDLQAVNFKELTILGTRVYTRDDFREAIELAPRLPLAKLITHEFPLARVSEAYSRFVSGADACKVMVMPNG